MYGLFAKVHTSARFIPVAGGTNTLAGSFSEDPVPFKKNDWMEMSNEWALAGDDPLVVGAEVDTELGIDGEGSGDTGSGDEDEEVEVAVVVKQTVLIQVP